MISKVPELFDRVLLRARRNRIALEDDVPDFLLRRVADDFSDRLALVRREFALAANIGAYSGLLSRQLLATSRIDRIIDVEPAERLLRDHAGPAVVADQDVFPFALESFDLIVSALSLHLVNDLPGIFAQVRGALKPDGLFLAALLGGETLNELREAWFVAEEEILGGASPRVAPFADVRDLGGLLQRAGFALPVADSDTVSVTYSSPLRLMQEIKAMGASNMLVQRLRTPVTRSLLLRAADVYVERFGLGDGRVPATFEIITLTGWAPHESQPKPLKPGSAQVRLADVLRPSPKDREAKE